MLRLIPATIKTNLSSLSLKVDFYFYELIEPT